MRAPVFSEIVRAFTTGPSGLRGHGVRGAPWRGAGPALVARGEIVHPTAASLADHYTHPGVSVIPLRGMPPLESALIWAAGRESAAIRAFAEVARRLSGVSRWQAPDVGGAGGDG
ncbi:hypothetical protein ABZ297_43130 [Nonomuraea sp. NPDC005983]|uniref:hypothetical protein n=1 Tax=Nonomuraea sp. NPDC005983 TaxID=3155595 RepID=UPI0033AA44F2